MADRIALVTGGSRGIGKQIAIRLAQVGYHVMINYRSNHQAAEQARNEIMEQGGVCDLYQWDVGNEQQTQQQIQAMEATYGKIAVLVNNAGVTRDKLMLVMSGQDFREVIDSNLIGAFHCIKAVSKGMLKRRQGVIINISSVSGLIGNVGQANYAASKAGLIGLTKSLAKEYGSRGIRVNAICPGFIDTDMTRALPEPIKQKMIEQIPLQRFGQPEDIAHMVAYLVSEQAKYITGQTITIDGGLTMI